MSSSGWSSQSHKSYNKQLQRTVTRRRGDGASAPFHYARPLNCGSKDFPLESTLQRIDTVQREADCKSLIGLSV